ncbi:MAG: hypothetical protein H7237_05630 [Alkalinema sp. FL-bin-369]|nr:hypothetical protein [Leptolyngbyaceae cyanobacterium LF-bin-369]
MPRTKRTSKVLENATIHFSGFRTIDDNLDYGNGFSVTEYETRINNLRSEIIQYNGLLSGIDEAGAKINALEQDLRTYSENILLTTQTRYGKTSLEYQKVGGRIRKTSKRKASATPATPLPKIATPVIPTTSLEAAMN